MHGTNRCYMNGCREEECRQAHRDYTQQVRQARRAELIWRDNRPFHPRAKHGTPNAYTHYGCGCEPCTKAHSAATRAYKESRYARVIGVKEEA